MESNWRKNIRLIGWGGQQFYLPFIEVEVMYAAKLVTPIPFFPFVGTYVVKLCGDGSCSGAIALQSFADPVQTEGFFGSLPGRFPYGFAVLPDN